MIDPALGRTRAQRAFGNTQDGVARSGRAKEFLGSRKIEQGMYSGPRASYSRYQVSEQAQDILNKQMRTYNR